MKWLVILCLVLVGCTKVEPKEISQPDDWIEAKEYLGYKASDSPMLADAVTQLSLKVKKIEKELFE